MALLDRLSKTAIYQEPEPAEALQLVATPITIIVAGEDNALSHWFANIDFYDGDDEATDNVVVPTAGTCAISITSLAGTTPNVPSGSPIDCTAVSNREVSFATNPVSITFTLAGLTGTATHWRARAIGNMS